jgi:uncharacterized protein YjiS (DUF1127 family)
MNHSPSLAGAMVSTSSPASVLRRIVRLIETYRRHVRAGFEIEALLSMSDAQLAARHLSRDSIGITTLARHGIDLGPHPRSSNLRAS